METVLCLEHAYTTQILLTVNTESLHVPLSTHVHTHTHGPSSFGREGSTAVAMEMLVSLHVDMRMDELSIRQPQQYYS